MATKPASPETKNAKKPAPSEPTSARGQKRRELIKAATRIVLEREGYRAMKVVDVASEAGVAAGLFYHYFPDLKSVTCEVLSDFLQEMAKSLMPEPKGRYDAIYTSTLVMVKAFDEHPGLMRCLVQVADEVPEFKVLWDTVSIAWTKRVANSIERQFPDAKMGDHFASCVAYALGSMVDGLVNEVYVHQNPDARKLLRKPQDLAELLAVMWYHALYLENPPLEALKLTAPVAGMVTPSAPTGPAKQMRADPKSKK